MLVSVVPETAPEMTVARYIARAWPLVPAFAVRDAFKKRDVKVNGVRADAEKIVRAGDEIKAYIPDMYAPGAAEVVFSDGFLIAFVKPFGLPVDTDSDGIGEDTALNRLKTAHPDARLVHRLDAGTGGIMLAAANAEAEEKLINAFSAHKIEKHYAALALGRMPKRQDTLCAFLEKDAKEAKVFVRLRPSGNARAIETRYRMTGERSVRGVTLSELDVEIPTGRTHQIRAHLAFIDHPLAGDDKYGNRAVNRQLGLTEPCLFCKSLEIRGAMGLETYDGMCFSAPDCRWKM